MFDTKKEEKLLGEETCTKLQEMDKEFKEYRIAADKAKTSAHIRGEAPGICVSIHISKESPLYSCEYKIGGIFTCEGKTYTIDEILFPKLPGDDLYMIGILKTEADRPTQLGACSIHRFKYGINDKTHPFYCIGT
jgi:hypothetical protein